MRKFVSVAKAAVWVVVAIWFTLPIFWLIFMFITDKVENRPVNNPPPQFAPQPAPGGGSLVLKLMSSAVMIGLLFYGAWCAFGVVVGFGLDRMIQTAENCYAAFFLREVRIPPPT